MRVYAPREQSSPGKWAVFCRDLTVLLVSNHSVASALGKDVDAVISSALQLAEPWFTDREREMHAAWKKGRVPPRVDWKRLRDPSCDATPAQRARWAEMTDALRVVYDDAAITRENCKAWVEKHGEMMPLVNACKKIEAVRHDMKLGKATGSSKARRDVAELVTCRAVMADIGKQRVRSNTHMKTVNKHATDREAELTKRLEKINAEVPKDKEAALSKFGAREATHGKLTRSRVERVEMAAEVSRQNVEIDTVEHLLKERMEGLEERLRRARA